MQSNWFIIEITKDSFIVKIEGLHGDGPLIMSHLSKFPLLKSSLNVALEAKTGIALNAENNTRNRNIPNKKRNFRTDSFFTYSVLILFHSLSRGIINDKMR